MAFTPVDIGKRRASNVHPTHMTSVASPDVQGLSSDFFSRRLVNTPVPNGLVRRVCIPPARYCFLHPFGRLRLCDSRETKIGSGASARVSARQRDTGLTAGKTPPRSLRAISGDRVIIGQPRIAIAIIGLPPIARNIADGVCCRNAAGNQTGCRYRHKRSRWC